jgi:hypothetical protein
VALVPLLTTSGPGPSTASTSGSPVTTIDPTTGAPLTVVVSVAPTSGPGPSGATGC